METTYVVWAKNLKCKHLLSLIQPVRSGVQIRTHEVLMQSLHLKSASSLGGKSQLSFCPVSG